MTIDGGTQALLDAIAAAAPFERLLGANVSGVRSRGDRVEVETRDGTCFPARAAVIAVPLNVLGQIEFAPALPEDKHRAIALGQASRGVKIFIHARGEPRLQSSIRPGHPFGYLGTDALDGDGSQLLIGFGTDAAHCDPGDLPDVQRALDAILPGYEALGATAHDWLADEHSSGTWAIHRPGWYEHHHAAMRRAEGRLVFAGSDLANGWAGFIDGAIESGLCGGALAAALA